MCQLNVLDANMCVCVHLRRSHLFVTFHRFSTQSVMAASVELVSYYQKHPGIAVQFQWCVPPRAGLRADHELLCWYELRKEVPFVGVPLNESGGS